MLVVIGVAVLGWEPPPWKGQVRVCRSPVHRAKIPHEAGMRVKDAIALSRSVLGQAAREQVAVYRWRPWLFERIPDATVMGMQGALGAVGLHGWSDALWQWWDGVVPRQDVWQRVAREGDCREWLLESGELVVLVAEP